MVNSTIWASSLKLQQTLVQIGVTLALLFLTWPRYRTCFWSWITMGKLIPFCASRVGCGFPKVPLGETTSRFTPLKWGAVSRRGPSGKRHPILGPKSGIRFPAGMKKASAARVAAEALFVAAHCVWVVEMSRFAPKEEGIDLRVMPDE